MATTDRPRRRRPPASSGPDPASRGLILVAVAVVLGVILIASGGAIGFDSDDTGVDIPEGGDEATPPDADAETVPTTAAPPVTVAPAEVRVVVANGAGVSGLAGRTTDFLATQGYTNSAATDAVGSAAATAVYFAEGFEGNAGAIAELFGVAAVAPIPPEAVANDQPADAAVIVVLGPDAVTAIDNADADASATAPADEGTATTTTAAPAAE